MTFVRALIRITFLVLLLAVVCQPIILSSADLGRHLTNGHLILSAHSLDQWPIYANFYSYTFPDFVLPNHHWGSGVVFALVEDYGGMDALSFFYFFMVLATFALSGLLAEKMAGFRATALAAIVTLPLFAYRVEVRPEVFSYFLLTFFILMLWLWRERRISAWGLLSLPLVLTLWINLHIYWVFGLLSIGAFFTAALGSDVIAKKLLNEKPHYERAKILAGVLGLCLVMTCANPFGYRLLLFPFEIFHNYGYRIVENQSLWFFINLKMYIPILVPGAAAIAILLIGALFSLRTRLPALLLQLRGEVLIGFGIGIVALTGLRNYALFAVIALPLTAMMFARLSNAIVRYSLIAIGVAASLFFFWQMAPTVRLQYGLEQGMNASADFFVANHLRGPIFNNYDIGGYLIYHFFPTERVYTDNRPEAYPSEFFSKTYIPMQEDDTKWNEVDAHEHFNVIYFYRPDFTPWAQAFMIRRLHDTKNWAPVFVDRTVLMFLRRTPANADVIRRFELPQSMFNVAPTGS